jgi:hypothetical protein
MTKRSVIYVVLILTLASASSFGIHRRKVLVQEAKQLVWQALPEKAKYLQQVSLEGGPDSNYPGFYVFSVTWAGAPNGSAVYGNYAVDESTGDVFDAVSECNEISTPSLRTLQVRIRSRISLSDSDYRKIKGNGPMCMQGNSNR